MSCISSGKVITMPDTEKRPRGTDWNEGTLPDSVIGPSTISASVWHSVCTRYAVLSEHWSDGEDRSWSITIRYMGKGFINRNETEWVLKAFRMSTASQAQRLPHGIKYTIVEDSENDCTMYAAKRKAMKKALGMTRNIRATADLLQISTTTAQRYKKQMGLK